MDAVILENVTKHFGKTRAVDHLDLRVPAGVIYGVLGPNGAGKTTTLRMIMNIIFPDSGRIEVLGHPQTSEVTDRIGYLPEERGLYRKMRVRDMLAYIGRLKGVSGAALSTRIAERLDAVGLAGYAAARCEELSKGMQQKLQFLVATIHDPELLILDEPFSGLDPVNADALRQMILDFKAAGRTILFSTHVMHQAEQMCDRFVLIDRGRKIADATLDELRSRFPSDSVLVECDTPPPDLRDWPEVASTRANGRALEISLRPGSSPQTLLQRLAGSVTVRRFEMKRPSLDEIFIALVGSNHE